MGPVWVDMFYSWKDQGKLPPSIKLALLAPGMPGQPMYYVIPAKAANPQLARDFIALATSPEVQAQGIVKQFKLVSGHRRRAGEAEAGCGDLAKAVCRNLAGSAGEVWQKLPDRPLL